VVALEKGLAETRLFLGAEPALERESIRPVDVRPVWRSLRMDELADRIADGTKAGGNRSNFERLKLHLTALCVGYLKEVSTTALGEHP
jgi:hypothetical protein